jgi:hypothetical protein
MEILLRNILECKITWWTPKIHTYFSLENLKSHLIWRQII